MKNTRKFIKISNRARSAKVPLLLTVLTVIIFSAALVLTGCGDSGGGGDYYESDPYNKMQQFNDWLESQPANNPDTAYTYTLNVGSLPGGYWVSIKNVLGRNVNKYVNLDLSGSTFTSIGDEAFYFCTSLVSITIPDSVTSIGESAFSSCTSLTSITIPDSVTSIGGSAFSNCSSLTSVTILDSVTSIGYKAFSSCTSLVSVTIGNSVTTIGDSAFHNCTNLTSITIPDSVTSIGRSAFYGTAWLNNQPNGVVYAGKVALTYKGDMPANTSINISNGTIGIADSAFDVCTTLISITIPNSVTSIGRSAFSSCNSLTGISVDSANTEYSSQDGVLYNKNKTTLIQYPKGKTGAFTIPNSVTTIEDSAFSSCNSLVSITIPDSVTTIGEWAFYYCTSLIDITIPDSVTSIGYKAFSSCTSLVSVTFTTGSNIPTNSFGDSAFPEWSGGNGGNTLKTAYSTGKAGTYTRAADGGTWTKQQ